MARIHDGVACQDFQMRIFTQQCFELVVGMCEDDKAVSSATTRSNSPTRP